MNKQEELLSLQARAREACELRGHAIEWIHADDDAGASLGRCRKCGKEVQCLTVPAPNQIGLGGAVLAEDCSGFKLNKVWEGYEFNPDYFRYYESYRYQEGYVDQPEDEYESLSIEDFKDFQSYTRDGRDVYYVHPMYLAGDYTDSHEYAHSNLAYMMAKYIDPVYTDAEGVEHSDQPAPYVHRVYGGHGYGGVAINLTKLDDTELAQELMDIWDGQEYDPSINETFHEKWRDEQQHESLCENIGDFTEALKSHLEMEVEIWDDDDTFTENLVQLAYEVIAESEIEWRFEAASYCIQMEDLFIKTAFDRKARQFHKVPLDVEMLEAWEPVAHVFNAQYTLHDISTSRWPEEEELGIDETDALGIPYNSLDAKDYENFQEQINELDWNAYPYLQNGSTLQIKNRIGEVVKVYKFHSELGDWTEVSENQMELL